MPFPQTEPAIRRPPLPYNISSPYPSQSSTQDVPSFVEFMSRTPTPEQQISMPSILSQRRRSSSVPIAGSCQSSSLRPLMERRSSSIYSRAFSQWEPEENLWQSSDFADGSFSTMHNSAHDVEIFNSREEELSSARGFITKGQQRSYSQGPTAQEDWSRPSTLLPPTPISMKVPEGSLHSVSLKRVDESIVSPSTTRCQVQSQELRSHTPRYEPPAAYLGDGSAETARVERYQSPNISTPPSEKGQDTLPLKHFSTHSPSSTASTMENEVHRREMVVGRGQPKVMVSLANQAREESRTKVTQSLGLLEPDEPRGRTRRRGPRQMDYTHYLPQAIVDDTDGPDDGNASTDARKIAQQYHAVLTDQYRQGSACSDSDESVKRHMKMVPQALFYGKPPPRPSLGLQSAFDTDSSVKSVARTGSASSVEGRSLRHATSSNYSGRHTRSPGASRLRTLLTHTPSDHSRQSSTGSIPISPPDSFDRSQVSEVRDLPPTQASLGSSVERQNKRVSAFYPHVMSRKKGKGLSARALRLRQQQDSERPQPSKLVLAADIMAERDRTEDLLLEDPVADSQPPTSPMSQQERTDSVHLGWSEMAKASFDRSRASGEQKLPSKRIIEHIVTPAKPLGLHNQAGPEDSAHNGGRRSSVFSGIREFRREAKAETRRRELRKVIRVVQERGGEDASVVI